MVGGCREVVVDFGFLSGRQNDTVVQELCVASATASELFRFKSPYTMAHHGSSENVINWAVGHIEYRDLKAVVNEAVAGFAHLYIYGISKVEFLGGLRTADPHPGGPQLPPARRFQSVAFVPCPTITFRNSRAQPERRIPSSIRSCTICRKRDFVQCPPHIKRHSADFVTAL